jgi:hypothetical protein
MSTNALLRPSCLDLVPEWLESFLGTCPHSPNGVHQWLAKAAWRMHDHLNSEEQVKVLRWAIRGCGRAPQPSEIERTVANIGRKRDGQFHAQCFNRWPAPVPSEIDKIVCRGPWDLSAVNPVLPADAGIDDSTNKKSGAHNWLPRLFPVGSLLCISQELVFQSATNLEPYISRRWHTRRLETWTDRYAQLCDASSLLVPNPAAFTWHYTIDRRPSTRCNAMFPVRLYLVVEFDFSEKSRDGQQETAWAPSIRKWKKRGISIRGACAALLWHLSQYAPLVLVVWSGGKSSHGWFNVAGIAETKQRAFMEYSCSLGGDSATWTRCQLVRLPEGLRPNGNRQTVEYFDPSSLPDF